MATKLNITGWEGCGFFTKAVQAAKADADASGLTVEVNTMPRDAFREWVQSEQTKFGVKHTSSPFVLKDGKFLGGCDDTLSFLKTAKASSSAVQLVDDDTSDKKYDFDLIVIGGGSGGMAASKAAAKYLTKEGEDPKVCCLDFVKPTPIGTKWGFGGTCVNVGCIPKKLFHTAAIHRDAIQHSHYYGADEANAKTEPMNWERARENIQMHIKSLNFGSVAELRTGNVKYKNSLGAFIDPHTVECTNKKGVKETITGRRILLAMGGRPKYPDIPGAKEFGITSDDVFSLEKSPGKTLVVGASYIALECAGFLTGMGYDATVLMRSIPLRGFDQQIAEKICDFMAEEGTKFIKGATPTSLEKNDDGTITTTLSNGEKFISDTVLFAVGRVPDASINLEAAGVKTAPSGKIITNTADRTSASHIYAIGDVIEGGLELTPVAIQAGRLLTARLYDGQAGLMNQNTVPTTVFTPLEYGVCGYAEEDAVKEFGESAIEVYHTNFKPLEWTVAQKPTNACYLKMITLKKDGERVIGFHILTPNAGEILQGVAVAMKAGAKKHHFDDTVGIHPTVAELMTTMNLTKASGASADQAGC
eukprot:TRINITY_DN1605_c1_g3_i1.p1 TRINITY_DN1605_c1_g3~~TRINITY_DN1605_c1_g3_i1.p1  ORF type:complete len:589 (+),score=114.02 TRINITY_DN1605_c1_g3_i1:118-1884(+)